MKKYINNNTIIILYLFIIISLSSMFFAIYQIKFHQNNNIKLFYEMIKKEAISYYNIVILNREWTMNHGVIYLKQNDKIEANSNLKDNIVYTTNNEKLLKVNPAWMTRQLSKFSQQKQHPILFKMVSLKPTNPVNMAKDEFEVEALNYFQKNKDEKYYSRLSKRNKKFYFMGSLKIEKDCLKCHSNQNYKIGDVSGGLKVVIPAEEYIAKSDDIKQISKYWIFAIIFTTLFITLFFIWLFKKINKEQKKLEKSYKNIKKLETSNETLIRRYKFALDGSKYGIWDWDIVKNEVFFDENWKRILGYENDEVSSSFAEWTKRVHPDDIQQALDDILANKDGKTKYYENIHRIRHKNGSWIWILDKGKAYFDENNKPIRMVGFQVDITNLKKLELELSESKQNLLLAQKISNMAYWKLNIQTNEFHVSDTFYELLGIKKDELKSYEDLKSFIKKEDLLKVTNEHKSILSLKKKAVYYYTLMKKNGAEVVVEEHLDFVENELTHDLNILGTIHDMSNRMELEKRLREKDELMLHQSRSAAMGEMISMIAHQWRQPITTISMNANNILANIELDMLEVEETKKIALNIAQQTQYLSKTIDDFRNFFMEDKQTSILKVGELFDETCTIILASLKNNDIELKLDFDRDIEIQTYTRELLQVLLNILKNAKEAFEDKNIEHKTIKVSVKDLNDYINIIIEDNAGGIPKDKLDKIFDAYFTTKKDQNGTGLGLYMSQSIVQKHLGGKIEVYNTAKGAVFEVRLKKFI